MTKKMQFIIVSFVGLLGSLQERASYCEARGTYVALHSLCAQNRTRTVQNAVKQAARLFGLPPALWLLTAPSNDRKLYELFRSFKKYVFSVSPEGEGFSTFRPQKRILRKDSPPGMVFKHLRSRIWLKLWELLGFHFFSKITLWRGAGVYQLNWESW